ncbi:unnamed protein product [Didymodactylos carnosus]|uniref:Phospholipid scramblase n=1 Tax=Didymodactylos carnosus TaxID=1234261 RepID=A0A815KSS3_9BILA|nr:unnamed protein product [Didymodactylos carnosus]CAF4291384.1 unnamed protein product [Didymodactylos carnosus]
MQQYQPPPPYNYQFTPNDQQTPLKQVPIQQQPIFQQPGNPTPPHQSTSAVQWVTQPQHVQPGIPPGLSYLVDVDYLALKQNPSITQSKYYITKRFKCCAGCCWCAGAGCCAHEVFVESPPGMIVGSVTQECSFLRGHYTLRDAAGEAVLKAVGPFCICQGVCCCCCENKFTTEVGAIFKEYAGFVNEAFTGAEAYTIQFPQNLSVQMKAVALATLFLVNYVYFARNSDNQGLLGIYELLRNFEFGLRTTDLVDCSIQLKSPIIPLLFEDIEWPPIGLSTAMAEYLYIRFYLKQNEKQNIVATSEQFG